MHTTRRGALAVVVLASALHFSTPAADAHRVNGTREHCHTKACHARVTEARWQERWARVPSDWKAWARRTAYCETGGTMNPSIHNPSGIYHGLGQFDLRTWAEAGGAGDPHNASSAQQLWRMQHLARRVGTGRWPTCG